MNLQYFYFKNILSTLSFCTLLSLTLNGQTDTTKSNQVKYPNFVISGHGGMTSLKTSPGILSINYVDESPSQDNLKAKVPISEANYVFNLGVFADIQYSSGIFLRAGIEGSLGTIKSIEANFGIGYLLHSKPKYQLRLLGLFSYGSAWINLGELYQNDVYIEVNNTQFYSESVAIDLNRKHLLASPEFEVAIPFKKNKNVFMTMNAGYQFPLNAKTSHLRFTGLDINNEETSASEAITAKNVNLKLNDAPILSNFIGVKGLTLKIGVSLAL